MQGRPVLLYDGDCGFCTRWALWAHRKGADVEFQPCQEAKTLRAALGIPEARCQETAIYVDDAGMKTHQDAVNAVLRRIPGGKGFGWRTLGRMGGAPGLRALGGVGYRWVAKNRHRFHGPKGHDEDAPHEGP